MPTRFYDPNDTEQKRLLRASMNPDNQRSFTDSVGRTGIETRQGDMRVRIYDGENGGVHFEQRGPGGELRSFGTHTTPDLLRAPPTTPQIAPDRTGADRLARAISDGGGWDKLATPEQRGLAGVGAIGGEHMVTRAEMLSGFSVNPNDLMHERSFGTNAVLASRARGFGGPPTAVEMFGTDDQKKGAQGIYDRAREQYLMDQAGLNGLARSAAGGTAGRAAALRELEAMRLQRAQENMQQSADLARREGFANEQTVAGITAQGKIDAAAAAGNAQIEVAKENGQARRDAETTRAESNEKIAKMQTEAAGKRPIPLGGGAGAFPNEDGTYEIKTTGADGKQKSTGVRLAPGDSYYNPADGSTFVAPGADRKSIEQEIGKLTEAIGRALTPEQMNALKQQLDDAHKRLAALPGGSGAGAAPAGGSFAGIPVVE